MAIAADFSFTHQNRRIISSAPAATSTAGNYNYHGQHISSQILNETGEGLIELKTIMEKKRAIPDGEERQIRKHSKETKSQKLP